MLYSVQHQVGQQGREKIDQSDVVLESHETSSSLQSQASTPPDILAQDPLHIIRYIVDTHSLHTLSITLNFPNDRDCSI